MERNGHKRLHNDHETVYSGEDHDTDHGMALMFELDIAHHIKNIKYVNEGVIAVTLKLRGYWLLVIYTYASKQGRKAGVLWTSLGHFSYIIQW